MLKATKLFLAFILPCTLICVLFGCAPAEEELRVGEAYIRVINASPEENEYSFFINDTLRTGQPLKFGEASAYLNVSAGTNAVYTQLNNQTLANTNIELFLGKNANYSLFLAGKASTDSLIYVSTLDRKQVLSDTMATVRFINVSPDAPNLNLVFQKNLIDSVNVISNINYRTASQYVKIHPLNYFLRIKKSSGASLVASMDNYKLEAGKIYTFWTKGLVKDTNGYALELEVLLDN